MAEDSDCGGNGCDFSSGWAGLGCAAARQLEDVVPSHQGEKPTRPTVFDSGEQGVGRQAPSFLQPILPPDVLLEIFKHLPKGQSSLRSSRQVCKLWKETIDSSPELMRRITVRISDLAGFFENFELKNIAAKAKGVCFQGFKKMYKVVEIDKLFQLIGSYVEKVKFQIETPSRNLKNEQRLLVRFLECKKLVELHFASTTQVPFLLAMLDTTDLDISKSSVKVLSIEFGVATSNEPDFERIGKFILGFPSLSQLKLMAGTDLNYTGITTGTKIFELMIECIRKYKNQLQILEYPEQSKFYYSTTHLEFLFLCKKYDLDFYKPLDKVAVCANTIRRFQATEELPIDNDPKYLAAVRCIGLGIGDRFVEIDANMYRRINLCVNLKKVELSICDPARREEVLLLASLSCIEITGLKIFDSGYYHQYPHYIPADIFSVHWPTLKSLTIDNQVFESSGVLFSIASSFPGLEGLSLKSCSGLDRMFICYLTRLKKLTTLELVYFPYLIDIDKALLMPCKVVEKDDGKSECLPAIASFKQLKTLKLFRYDSTIFLSDAGLKAIAKNPTLSTLQVRHSQGSPPFSTAGMKFLSENSKIDVQCNY